MHSFLAPSYPKLPTRFREDPRFKTKPQIALEQLHWACAAGVPRGVVLMDAGYGA